MLRDLGISIAIALSTIGVSTSSGEATPENYPQQVNSDQSVPNPALYPRHKGDSARVESYKPNADDKIAEWLFKLFDFRATDLFIVLFTWMLVNKTGGSTAKRRR